MQNATTSLPADAMPSTTPVLAIDARRIPEATGGAISRTRAYEAMGSGQLRYRQAGRKRLVLVDDLMAFLDALPTGTVRAS